MIHVLIVLWFAVGGSGGKAVHSQEFSSRATCEAAAVQVGRQSEYIRTICVPK